MATISTQPRVATASEWRWILSIAAPLIAGNLAQMMLTTTDVLLIGRLGGTALAAGALAASFYQAVSVFCGGLVMATTPLIAASLGRGDSPFAIRLLVASGLWTALLIGVPAWLALGQTEAILGFLGQSPELAAGAAEMMLALRWAIFPYLIYILFRGLLSATGHAGSTFIVVLIAVGLNAVLGWGLILGNLGLPQLGLRGAGIASALSSLALALGALLVAWRHPRLAGLRLLGGPFRPDFDLLGKVWRLGVPIGIALACEMGIFYAAMLMAGALGPDVLAAHAVAMQIASVCFMLPFGFGQAATVRVGYAFGAGDCGLAQRAARAAWLLGIGCVVATGLVTAAWPHGFLSLFLDDRALAASGEAGVAMLRIAALFLLASATQTIATGALRGLQDTRAPMLIAGLGYWGVGLPAALLLGFRFELGGPGIWMGLTLGLTSVAGLMTLRWQRHVGRFSGQSA